MTQTNQNTASAQLDDERRATLAQYADLLIAGGASLPSASEADVHGRWIDRTLAARPDLAEPVNEVISRDTDATSELKRIQVEEPGLFDKFSYAIAGAYLMNPRVRKGLGLPGAAPVKNPAYQDEADYYLADGILDPVIERGPIYRSTPPSSS